jgi:hypothetical protein
LDHVDVRSVDGVAGRVVVLRRVAYLPHADVVRICLVEPGLEVAVGLRLVGELHSVGLPVVAGEKDIILEAVIVGPELRVVVGTDIGQHVGVGHNPGGLVKR